MIVDGLGGTLFPGGGVGFYFGGIFSGWLTKPLTLTPADLAKRVQFELFQTDAFNTRTIQIKAEDGAVTLSGSVRSRAEQLLAERVAQNVSGVKKVVNELKVSAAAARPGV
jgi:hypothetical protein